jgi:Tfp pilus assembly protein PilN
VYAFADRVLICLLSPDYNERLSEMGVHLNLASRPFRNRALPWTIAVVVSAVSLLVLAWIVTSTLAINSSEARQEVRLNDLRNEAKRLVQIANEVNDSLTLEQRETLDAAHTVIRRKGFSWSRLFSDLEAFLPNTVKVTRINVRDLSVQNQQSIASLEMTVLTKSSVEITDMIATMDREAIFHAEIQSEALQRGRGEGGTEFVLAIRYTPRASSKRDVEPNSTSVASKSESAGSGGRQ